MEKAVLVTGATGNVGRHVVSQLLSAGLPVRALTRNPASADLPREAQIVGGDLYSIPEHLDGVDAVFLVWRHPVAPDGTALFDAIAKKVSRIVFLSSSAVRDDIERQTNPIGQVHADMEDLIARSGLQWTSLRPGGFAANARWWAPQIRESDVVRWPYGAAAGSPIHERDIAAVAVRALTSPDHVGAKYILTGPESLTQIEQVRAIGQAIGRPLRFEEISPEAARPLMLAQMPAYVVDLLLEVWARMVVEPQTVTSTVTDITGAPAHTFQDWAIEHASDFHSNQFPDINRPDAGAVLVSEWKVGSPERQREMIKALAAEWEQVCWPRGLLSVNLFASTRGAAVLEYSQWTNDDACREAVRVAASGEPVHYNLYRHPATGGAKRIPGCIVIVSVEFDGPDRQRQKAWVDSVFDALESEPAPPQEKYPAIST